MDDYPGSTDGNIGRKKGKKNTDYAESMPGLEKLPEIFYISV